MCPYGRFSKVRSHMHILLTTYVRMNQKLCYYEGLTKLIKNTYPCNDNYWSHCLSYKILFYYFLGIFCMPCMMKFVLKYSVQKELLNLRS